MAIDQIDPPNKNAILIASHPRSGTHLLIDFLRRQFPVTRAKRFYGLPLDHLYLNIERLTSLERRFEDSKAQSILAKAQRPIIKTHYLADFSETWVRAETGSLSQKWQFLIHDATIVYVYRDPRDVMVSLKQFLSPLDESVARATLPQFIRMPHWNGRTSMLGWWAEHVSGWLLKPGVLGVPYEKIISETERLLNDLAVHTKMVPICAEPLLPPKVKTVAQTRLNRLFSRSPDSTAIIANAKRFSAVPWQQECSMQDEIYLDEIAGRLLDQLGYRR